jgi:hypothetical protein
MATIKTLFPAFLLFAASAVTVGQNHPPSPSVPDSSFGDKIVPSAKNLIVAGTATEPTLAPSARTSRVILASDWLPQVGGAIHAQLFDEPAVDIIVDSIKAESGGVFVQGHIRDHPELPTFFGCYGSSVSGSIMTALGARTIHPSADGFHMVGESDLRVRDCYSSAEAFPVKTAVGIATSGEDLQQVDSVTANAATLSSANTIVDIMMLYSTAAKTAFGGESGILSTIILYWVPESHVPEQWLHGYGAVGASCRDRF